MSKELMEKISNGKIKLMDCGKRIWPLGRKTEKQLGHTGI